MLYYLSMKFPALLILHRVAGRLVSHGTRLRNTLDVVPTQCTLTHYRLFSMSFWTGEEPEVMLHRIYTVFTLQCFLLGTGCSCHEEKKIRFLEFQPTPIPGKRVLHGLNLHIKLWYFYNAVIWVRGTVVQRFRAQGSLGAEFILLPEWSLACSPLWLYGFPLVSFHLLKTYQWVDWLC